MLGWCIDSIVAISLASIFRVFWSSLALSNILTATRSEKSEQLASSQFQNMYIVEVTRKWIFCHNSWIKFSCCTHMCAKCLVNNILHIYIAWINEQHLLATFSLNTTTTHIHCIPYIWLIMWLHDAYHHVLICIMCMYSWQILDVWFWCTVVKKTGRYVLHCWSKKKKNTCYIQYP